LGGKEGSIFFGGRVGGETKGLERRTGAFRGKINGKTWGGGWVHRSGKKRSSEQKFKLSHHRGKRGEVGSPGDQKIGEQAEEVGVFRGDYGGGGKQT